MRPLLDNLSLIQYQNLVRHARSAQPVRDQNRELFHGMRFFLGNPFFLGALSFHCDLPEHLIHLCLPFGIQGRGRLVQNVDWGFAVQKPCNR